MAYTVSYRTSADSALDHLDNSLRTRTERKLQQIANDEFRTPAQWGYTPFAGQTASGKFDFFNQVRVFVDINEEAGQITVHHADTRENLYR
jgi:mRNA-degrading endonuclease RelE of RelBE toxin-antitoxin system